MIDVVVAVIGDDDVGTLSRGKVGSPCCSRRRRGTMDT